MKRTLSFLLSLLLCSHACLCQTFDEWYKQNKTQKKYLLLQIAKLQTYMAYAKQGYQIVQGGLRLVGDIKEGDFRLHNDYFTHLQTVSPSIKKYSKVTAILSIQLQMLQTYRSGISKLNAESLLTGSNKGECRQIMEAVIDDALLDIGSLQAILTDGSFSMTDEERVEQIDQIYLSINQKKDLQRQFLLAVQATIHQRKQSSSDMNYLLDLIKP
jgi:hypothetical protein